MGWYDKVRQRLVDIEVGLLLKIEPHLNHEFEAIYRIYGNYAVNALAKHLEDDDWAMRYRAAHKLLMLASKYGWYGSGWSKAVPALTDAIRDENEMVRKAAAWALYGRVEKSEDKVLCLCLTGMKEREIYEMGQAAVPGLINILKDESATLRVTAARTLAREAAGGDIRVELGKVRAALTEFVDAVKKKGNETETKKAMREATGHYVRIAKAQGNAMGRASEGMDGVILEGETPRQSSKRKGTYRTSGVRKTVVG